MSEVNLETIQWRNIKKVVNALADFCFGSQDDPRWGSAHIAIRHSLTAKDGLDTSTLGLEKLAAPSDLRAKVAKAEQERDAALNRVNLTTDRKLLDLGCKACLLPAKLLELQAKLTKAERDRDDMEALMGNYADLQRDYLNLRAKLTALEAPIALALRKAYQLGQTYWQQADSDSFIQHKKSDETQNKFMGLQAETVAMLKTTNHGE